MKAKQEKEYTLLRGEEAVYDEFELAIKIQVLAPASISEDLELVSMKATNEIKQQMIRDFHKQSKKSQESAAAEKARLLVSFPAGNIIFVESIPNGYCHLACCEHLPWFVVTTSFGRVKIGWRKSVINLDWSDSILKVKAEEMFSKEDTTKGDYMIHAWGYEKAAEYLWVLTSTAAERGK